MEVLQILTSTNKNIDVSHKIDLHYVQFKMHLHENYEIFFSLSDGNFFFVGNRIYEANKYDIFLFDNTDLHKSSVGNPGNYDRYVVSFTPGFVGRCGESYLKCFDKRDPDHTYKISLSPDRGEDFRALLDRLLAVTESTAYAREEKQQLLLCEILLFINEERHRSVANPLPGDKSENAEIREITFFINQNLDQNLSLDFIAKNFYVNKYYLCRTFKNQTGFGLNEYIRSCRLSRAMVLLQQGVSVSEVADRCGFGSDTYFISTFKRALGISPKKYAMHQSAKKT